MSTKNKSIVRLAVIALGALLVGLPVAARAAEPTTSSEADAMAQQYRDQAARFRALGGVGYKSGLVQRAEADAARYAALAERLCAPVAAETPRSSEADAMAQQYRDQAARFRAMGGVGYKSGLVQRAEADAARYAALAEELRAPVAAETHRSPEAEHYAKLAEQYRKMGGTGYKSGLVQWAEAQLRKYEAPAVSEAPATTQLACAR